MLVQKKEKKKSFWTNETHWSWIWFSERCSRATVLKVGHSAAGKQTRHCHPQTSMNRKQQTVTLNPPLPPPKPIHPLSHQSNHHQSTVPSCGDTGWQRLGSRPGDRNEEWGRSRRWSEICSSFLTRCANGLRQHWGRQAEERQQGHRGSCMGETDEKMMKTVETVLCLQCFFFFFFLMTGEQPKEKHKDTVWYFWGLLLKATKG